MADENSVPQAVESTPEPPVSEPKAQEMAPQALNEAKPMPEVQSDDWKALGEKYKQNEPVYNTYEQFEQVLQANPDLAQTLEAAVKEYVRQKSAPQESQSVQPGNQPTQAQVFDAVTKQNVDPVIALRNEMRFKDYASEFTREFQNANLPNNEKVLGVAFNGVVAELLKRNPDPLGNYTPHLVKEAFKAWHDGANDFNREWNSAYAAAKAKDQGPPSGSGGAPVRSTAQIMNAQERKAYIAENLRAAHNVQ